MEENRDENINTDQQLQETLLGLKDSVDGFCTRQEKKMRQLWHAIGAERRIEMNTKQTYFGRENQMNQILNKSGYGVGPYTNYQAVNQATNQVANYDYDHDCKNGLTDFIRAGVLSQSLSTKGLSSGDESGSYMMPHPVQVHIQNVLSLSGSIRSLARVTAISGDALEVVSDTEGGGNEVGWVSESDERGETPTASLSRQKISVHEVYAKPLISQKLLDDAAIQVDQWLVDNIASAMNRLENGAFVNGDGEGKPKGFLSYSMVPVGSGAFGSIEWVKTGKRGVLENIDVLYMALEAMKPAYLDGAVWYVSRSAIGQIRRLKTSDGMPIWQPSLLLNQPDMLLGYPVILSDDMPTARPGEASVPMVLANFQKGYMVVDRHDMRLLRDPYSSKPFVEFYASKRVGGDVVDFDAFKAISFSE